MGSASTDINDVINIDDITPGDVIVSATQLDISSRDSCNLYDFLVCTVVIGLICLFGLTGNVTSFVVLYKHKTETAAVFLLQCMAVFDSLLLVVSVIIYTLPSVYPYTGRLYIVYASFDYITM